MPKRIKGEKLSRTVTFNRADVDDEARTVPVSISSEAPYKRWFGMEVLSHEKKAIDMERAGTDNGLPIRVDHSGKVVGRLKSIKLRDKRLGGIAHFSKNSKVARETFADVKDGILTDTSVEYEILEHDRDGESLFENSQNPKNHVTITRWRPLEAAIVAVPADSSVGINRSKDTIEGQNMPGEDNPKKAAKKGDDLNIADFETARKTARADGYAEGAAAEAERVKVIYRSFDPHSKLAGVTELRQTCLDEGTSAKRANELLLEWIAGEPEPASRSRQQAPGQHGTDIETVIDESDAWIDGVTRALELKCGLVADREEARKERKQNQFLAMSLQDMSRDYLVRQRVSVAGLDRMSLVGQSFTRAGQFGTSDFSNVLGNVASKSMMIGFDEAPETWRTWARIGTLQDFKVVDRVNLSTFSDLVQILESDEYQMGGMSDLKETIQLATYGRTFGISRQAIINDDLQAFSDIPRRMGRAANRKIGDVAYALLTGNPTLNQDATALFAAGHNNLGTTGAISETTLDEFGKLMAAQTSPAPKTGETGATLNISPKYLLVPRALLMSATKAIRTVTAPVQGTNTGDLTVNTQFGVWEPVWDNRLDADSVTEYYALADQNMFDTAEVAFLDGVDEPFLDSQDGWSTDGVEYKVRIDAAAAIRDFRGMCRNAIS